MFVNFQDFIYHNISSGLGVKVISAFFFCPNILNIEI
jgi:hypothetical protein